MTYGPTVITWKVKSTLSANISSLSTHRNTTSLRVCREARWAQTSMLIIQKLQGQRNLHYAQQKPKLLLGFRLRTKPLLTVMAKPCCTVGGFGCRCMQRNGSLHSLYHRLYVFFCVCVCFFHMFYSKLLQFGLAAAFKTQSAIYNKWNLIFIASSSSVWGYLKCSHNECRVLILWKIQGGDVTSTSSPKSHAISSHAVPTRRHSPAIVSGSAN